MGIVKKVKLWWKTTPVADKLMVLFGGISAAASITGAVYAVKEVKDLKVEVNLYPGNGKDPIPLKGERREEPPKEVLPEEPRNPMLKDPVESRSQYEQAVGLYGMLEDLNDKIADCEVTQKQIDDAREAALELAWDLAAKEDRMDEAEKDIPYQLYD